MPDQCVVLLLQHKGDGPYCRVRNVFQVEVITEDPNSQFAIVHRDLNKRFHVSGAGVHILDIPAGTVRVERITGKSPATIYAWS